MERDTVGGRKIKKDRRRQRSKKEDVEIGLKENAVKSITKAISGAKKCPCSLKEGGTLLTFKNSWNLAIT